MSVNISPFNTNVFVKERIWTRKKYSNYFLYTGKYIIHDVLESRPRSLADREIHICTGKFFQWSIGTNTNNQASWITIFLISMRCWTRPSIKQTHIINTTLYAYGLHLFQTALSLKSRQCVRLHCRYHTFIVVIRSDHILWMLDMDSVRITQRWAV